MYPFNQDAAMDRDALNHPPHPDVQLVVKQDPEDLIRWPDGTECYRYELHEMRHMSDDYEVIPFTEEGLPH